MADRRPVIARRELRSLADEKTIVLALLIQLFIAAFSSFLVVGLVSMYDPGSVAGYETDAAVTGEAADDLLAVIEEEPGMSGREYPTEADAREAFRDGAVDVVLTTERADGRVQVTVVVADESIRSTVVVVQVRETLRAYERAERLDRAAYLSRLPLPLPPRSSASPYFGFTYTVLVPLLLLLPAFISGSITVDSLTEEVDRGTLELLRVTPVTLTDIVDGKLLAGVVIAPAQAALWLGLLALNGTLVVNVWPLLGLTTAFTVAVCGLGAGVALVAPERQAAQFLYSTGVIVLFGAASLLPGSPANTVARLAVGSADAGVYAAAVGYAVVSLAAYAGVRLLVDRVDPGSLG